MLNTPVTSEHAAAKYLLDGGGGALVTMQGGRFVPLALLDMLDANTGRMRVRRVDVDSTTYAIARRYMIRLRKDDFASDETIKQYADLAGMDVAAFRNRFEPLVGSERAAIDASRLNFQFGFNAPEARSNGLGRSDERVIGRNQSLLACDLHEVDVLNRAIPEHDDLVLGALEKEFDGGMAELGREYPVRRN